MVDLSVIRLVMSFMIIKNFQELRENFQAGHLNINDINKLDLPLNQIPISEEGMETFNSIIDLLEANGFDHMVLTRSHGICKKRWIRNISCTYAVYQTNSFIELIIAFAELKYSYRIQFRRPFEKEKKEMSGSRSWTRFLGICKKYNVDITDYSIENGKEVKKTIPSAIIDCNPLFKNITLHNVHHIDIHSAHMAGVAESFPDIRPVIEECYNRRKEDVSYKSIMTHTWGFMQSEWVGYRYSHMSKAGIESTNRKVRELTERLENSGRTVLLHNTDGIWYKGTVFHDEGEGTRLGQWSNDHTNCTLRYKSKGIYEYIEDGKYTVVARGCYALDRIKAREDWVWGDIYNTGECIEFYLNKETNKIERVEDYDSL